MERTAKKSSTPRLSFCCLVRTQTLPRVAATPETSKMRFRAKDPWASHSWGASGEGLGLPKGKAGSGKYTEPGRTFNMASRMSTSAALAGGWPRRAELAMTVLLDSKKS